jgi:hypothetical protein
MLSEHWRLGSRSVLQWSVTSLTIGAIYRTSPGISSSSAT